MVRRPRAGDRPPAARRRPQEGDHRAGEAAGAPLAQDYARARERAETGVRLATRDGDYPLLGRGDVNLYSLFVERAQTLIKPSGIAGLLVPSGIASDMTASHFFRSVSTTGRIRALFDFENRGTVFSGCSPLIQILRLHRLWRGAGGAEGAVRLFPHRPAALDRRGG